MQKIRTVDTLPLDGGALCFHFINTVHSWKGINEHEYLNTYEDVITWCRKVDILSASQRLNLLKESRLHLAKARKALQQLRQTRQLLYQFFSSIAVHNTREISATVLARFNFALSNSFSHMSFKVKNNLLELDWNNPKNNLLEPLWIVIKSAFDLLTLEDRSRIKECSKCGWIFMDRTKNNNRRWCNPSYCGSIEKSKKYYRKIRQGTNA